MIYTSLGGWWGWVGGWLVWAAGCVGGEMEIKAKSFQAEPFSQSPACFFLTLSIFLMLRVIKQRRLSPSNFIWYNNWFGIWATPIGTCKN